MPLHEFQCTKCKHIFEKLLFKDDSDILPCPKCGKDSNKILSTMTYNMKGYSEKNGYSDEK